MTKHTFLLTHVTSTPGKAIMGLSTLKESTTRLASCITMLGVMAFPVFSGGVGSATAQTPARTMNGFEVSGRFLEEWGKQGSEQSSVYVNGLPITARRAEISMEDGRTYQTQWFERARYEAHPENPKPYDVLLGRLGATRVEGR